MPPTEYLQRPVVQFFGLSSTSGGITEPTGFIRILPQVEALGAMPRDGGDRMRTICEVHKILWGT